MEDPAEVNARLARAIGIMTAWNESDDGDTSFVIDFVSRDLAETQFTGQLMSETISMVTGLISLSGRLLVQLEQTTGTPIADILRRAGEQAAGNS